MKLTSNAEAQSPEPNFYLHRQRSDHFSAPEPGRQLAIKPPSVPCEKKKADAGPCADTKSLSADFIFRTPTS